MIKFLLATPGLVLEISAIATISLKSGSDGILFLCLLQHALASLLLALSGWYFMPEKFRHPRRPVTLLLFNVAFFIPLLGLPGAYAAAMLSVYRRHDRVLPPFAHLVLPEFVLSLREPEIGFSQGGIQCSLADTSIPTQRRLQSLLALQGIPARVSSPLLRTMLSDASDDIRLVAYGLLDSREKKITAQIHGELVNLRSAEGKELRLIGLRHLAELYWEIIYAGLAQGDLRTHALNQTLYYADAALNLEKEDTGLLFLKGRALLESRRYEEAQLILGLAVSHGLPESRAIPYIVEIAFNRRDYKTVQNLLSRLAAYHVTPIMKSAINFWVRKPDHRELIPVKENVV